MKYKGYSIYEEIHVFTSGNTPATFGVYKHTPNGRYKEEFVKVFKTEAEAKAFVDKEVE